MNTHPTPIIAFIPLATVHLPLLLQWLSRAHVKSWWDTDVAWTMGLVQEKYGPYIRGYRLIDEVKKPMYAYIIQSDGKPIGYIQTYNVHDFSREQSIAANQLPALCAALDFYIGEETYIGKGLGAMVLVAFLQQHVWPRYTACFVDPDKKNIAAIKTYENAGFKHYAITETNVLMVANRP